MKVRFADSERTALAALRELAPTWATVDYVTDPPHVTTESLWILGAGDEHVLVSYSIGGRKRLIRVDDIIEVIIGGEG